MSWGTELWDQYDNIATHTSKGIDFLEKYGNFVDQRCKIEVEYASKLRRLIKQFLPKKKEEEDYQFTYTKAYKNLLNELGDQAGQHEVIAENLSTQVVHELASLVKQLKEDRRKQLTEGARIQSQLQSSLNLLTKTKEKYEKAFGTSERALDAYQKADADLNLSRAEVEKQRMNSTIKSQQCDESKNEYANQLQKTNEAQNKYYTHLLPTVFQNLQDVDEKRIKCIQNFILKSVSAEKEVLPIVSQCLDGMAKCANEIDEKEDSRLVVERYKSGFSPPGDVPFEDLNSPHSTCGSGSGSGAHSDSNSSVNGSTHSIQTPTLAGSAEKKTILGTITGGRVKKRSGLLGLFGNNKEDFSDLPPNQRRKKLQMKIDELNGKVGQETAARDGLMKMKQVYEANPALGDPMSIQGQLTDNGHRLDKLRAELKKYQTFMDEMEGRPGAGSPANNLSVGGGAAGGGPASRKNSQSLSVASAASAAASSPLRRSSVSDGAESLSRSASDSSVSNPTAAANHAKGGGGGGVNNNNNSNGGGAGSNGMSTPLHSHGSTAETEPIRKVTCRILSPVAKPPADDATPAGKKPSSSISPESGIGMSSHSLPSSDHTDSVSGGTLGNRASLVEAEGEEDLDEEEEFFDPEPLPILGRCKALFPFEVTSEGSIRMDENEELWVIELDQGDGWTRVRRTHITNLDPMPEGFVPSSYIDVYETFSAPHPV